MANKLESLRGMDDLIPADSKRWKFVERRAHSFFSAWSYQELRTPILESTNLFSRSIGETTDIVHKEMYTFADRGDRSITMRPEMTASVARSVIQQSLMRNRPNLGIYYIGPMFRAERPQAGRKRQFHQIGAEFIEDPKDANDALADFYMITGIYRFFQFMRLENVKVKVNDLTDLNGDRADEIRGKLRDYFESHKDKLDEDSLYRLDKNVLRIFDSKDPKTKEVVAAVPWDEFVPERKEFSELVSKLEAAGVPVVREPKLVRGLDYYTGVVFEVVAEGLGAQDAVAGGGRYNKLYKELGGGNFHCTGFSIGFERLAMALDHQGKRLDHELNQETIYVGPIEEDGELLDYCQEFAYNLGLRGFHVEMNCKPLALVKHRKRADKSGCRYVMTADKAMMKAGEFLLRDMRENKEETDSLKSLVNKLCDKHYQELLKGV